MDNRAALAALLETLETGESHLVTLIELATRERAALVANDFAAIDDVTAQMLATAGELEACEERREELLAGLGIQGAGLREVIAFAEDQGVEGFSRRGERLVESANRLQHLQEQNARLIISAANLRERWLTMLTRIGPSTYSPRGRESSSEGRLVSRSA